MRWLSSCFFLSLAFVSVAAKASSYAEEVPTKRQRTNEPTSNQHMKTAGTIQGKIAAFAIPGTWSSLYPRSPPTHDPPADTTNDTKVVETRWIILCVVLFLALVLVTAKALSHARRRWSIRQQAHNNKSPEQIQKKQEPKNPRGLIGSGLDKYIDKLFDSADSNHDGTISFVEVYELILCIYVKLNRQAPIPAPSREKVDALFKTADKDKNGRLGREEFRRLSMVLASRASTRLIAHKLVTLLVAPLLAIAVVRWLSGKSWLAEIADPLVPDHLAEFVLKEDLWRTVFTVAFVATLASNVLRVAEFVLDKMQLKENHEGLTQKRQGEHSGRQDVPELESES